MTAITTSRYAIFNGYNLNSVPGLSVYAITPSGAAHRTINIFALANRNARKVSSAFYQSNTITLGIYITANTRELLESALDTLYANIQGQEASLVIPYAGRTARSYTCTYATSKINNALQNTDSPQGAYVDLTLTFECSDSYGYDQFFTPMIGPTDNLTSTPNSWNWTFIGSADTQVPILQFYFTGGTLGTGRVVVGNSNTGQSVSVTRTWAVGDTLIIDTQNKKVQVNGIDVDFTGAFPEFGLGLQTITYSDTLTSRQYQFYSYYYPRWV